MVIVVVAITYFIVKEQYSDKSSSFIARVVKVSYNQLLVKVSCSIVVMVTFEVITREHFAKDREFVATKAFGLVKLVF